MKNLFRLAALKVVLVAAIFLFGGNALSAQQLKFGYINSAELIPAMPERNDILQKLEQRNNDLSLQLEEIQVEFNNKLQAYNKDLATYSPAVKTQKESELTDIGNRLQQFRAAAEEDLQNYHDELMMPLITKAQEAIRKVSQANGFTAVFDLASGVLLYHDTKSMTDIMPLVKAELGIK